MSSKVFIIVSVMAAIVLVYAHAANAQVVKDGLVAYWTFDDIDGDDVPDSAGDFDGTIVDGPLDTVPGKVGKALEFNAEGYIDTESEILELGAADFSYSFWIKTEITNQCVITKDNGNNAWESAEKQVYVADSSTSEGPNTGPIEMVGWGNDWIRGSIEINDDEWHHIALTWDGTGHVYTDGEDGTFAVGFNGGADNPGNTVKIGITPGAHSAGRFEGLLDDFRLYERALEVDEIAEIMEERMAVDPASKLTGTWGWIKRVP